jgi:hypothetical protein
LIESHYELTIAYRGEHFGRVVFPDSLLEDTAKLRAGQIRHAMSDSYGSPGNWSFNLTKVHSLQSGEEVRF